MKHYTRGDGVLEDLVEAGKWYLRAANLGHADAQWTLALLYEEGEGVSQDYVEAVKWYRRSAEQGNVNGQSGLARIIHRA